MSIAGRLAAGVGAVGVLALGLGLSACQQEPTAVEAGGAGPAFHLFQPKGAGPFPAVVLVHGCDGLQRDTFHRTVWRGTARHAASLKENGYVALIVDSFGARGIADGCRNPLRYHAVQMEDAYAALGHLSALPFVDGARIGLVGFSLGGSAALVLAQHRRSGGRADGTFAALVAFYPWCEADWAYSLVRPVAILIGERDDWTPAWRCTALAGLARSRAGGPPLELVLYPDAHHAFDMPIAAPLRVPGAEGRYHTVAADDAARRDAARRMLSFFDRHLGVAR